MNKVYFHNPGFIDPRCFKMTGVSVKSDGAIGRFGTGLKYAIAGILRLGGKISILSGDDSFEFTTSKTTIRDKEFNVVACNGEELSFTTDYGQHWEPWALFRELHSNALDEGGDSTDTPLNFDPDTLICVECEEIAQEFQNKDLYFLSKDRSPLVSTKNLDIYAGASKYVYFKGVRVHEAPCSFTFNFKTNVVSLTEDRTLADSFFLGHKLGKEIASIDNVQFIAQFLEARKNAVAFEQVIRFRGEAILSPAWERTVVEHVKRGEERALPEGAVMLYEQKHGEFIPDEKPYTPREKRMLDKAIAFLTLLDYPVSNYPIRYCDFNGGALFGRAHVERQEIWLAPRAFENGCSELAQTILEEWMHLAEGHDDYTRAMQDWLFRQIIKQGEERLDEIL